MNYRQILQQYWGYNDFRGIQKDIISSIGAGKDTLGLMPTGGGKSITFQVPALAMDGVCIVITPLIALMKDQVKHLRDCGILAAAIYSGMTRTEIVRILENAIFGGVKILYVSPERLTTELFQIKLKHINVSFITVDEAHCISQWGYDFRPSYLSIADIRNIKPDIPILALTATATPEVVEDIQDRLHFREKNVFRMSFERKNLAYIVRNTSDKIQEIIHILNSVQGSAIVYARSRKRTKEVAMILLDNGISATWFHAGLETAVKDERQQQWQNDEIRVIVATNAFGMGIDKSNVRLVLHIDCPDSVEAYFQEAGRAGRDEKKAYSVLIYDNNDQKKLLRRIAETFPEKEYIRDIYEHLAYFFQIGIGYGEGKTFMFPIEKFCMTYHFFPVPVNSALNILEQCGYIHYNMEPDNNSRIKFKIERNDLYKIENLTAKTDSVITNILRNYTGTFTDYQYIEESVIGQQCGLTSQQVYIILKNLAARNIIDFIPQRSTPLITYLKDREDGEKIIIPKSVYDDRKGQYTKRINAILDYAHNDDICRSRQLLLYFGEETKEDCHQCDVCINHRTNKDSDKSIKTVKESILHLLSDKKKHHISEIRKMAFPDDKLSAAMEYLVSEEIISVTDGCYISYNSTSNS